MTRHDRGRLWAYLARRDRWRLHLGVGAILVLVAGAWLAPRSPRPAIRSPEDATVPLLREEFQRRDVATPFRQVPHVADAVSGSVVAFLAPAAAPALVHPDFGLHAPRSTDPQGYGLVVSADGDVLTHVAAIARRLAPSIILRGGGTVQAAVRAYDPDTGMVLVRAADASGMVEARLAGRAPAPGDLAAAITSLSAGGAAVTQPAYVAAVAPTAVVVAAFGEGLPSGTPVFTLDGTALALATGDARTARLAAQSLDRLLMLAGSGRAVPRTLGMRLQDVTSALRPFAGEAGVLVVSLDADGPAARAGVQVGDGLRAIDGVPVRSVSAAVSAIAALPFDRDVDVAVVRDSKDITIPIGAVATLADASARPPVPAPGPDAARRSPEGIAAGRVFPAASLATAGIPPEADVLEIDHRVFTERGAATHLRRSRGAHLVLIAHDGRRYFAVVEAAR